MQHGFDGRPLAKLTFLDFCSTECIGLWFASGLGDSIERQALNLCSNICESLCASGPLNDSFHRWEVVSVGIIVMQDTRSTDDL